MKDRCFVCIKCTKMFTRPDIILIDDKKYWVCPYCGNDEFTEEIILHRDTKPGSTD